MDDSYIYDTPTGIIEKEGRLFRGMTDAKNRPLWLRLLIIFFSLVIFVIPGLFLFGGFLIAFIYHPYLDSSSYEAVIPFFLGLLLLSGGMFVIYKNLKK